MRSKIAEKGSALTMSPASAVALYFSVIPKIIGFAAMLIFGWIIAVLIEREVAAILRTIRFNELARRSGFADFVQIMGCRNDSSGMKEGTW